MKEAHKVDQNYMKNRHDDNNQHQQTNENDAIEQFSNNELQKKFKKLLTSEYNKQNESIISIKIFNFSSTALTSGQLSLLQKGLKFTLTTNGRFSKS